MRISWFTGLAAAVLAMCPGSPPGAQTVGRQLAGVDDVTIVVAQLSDREEACGLKETTVRATAQNFLLTNNFTLSNDSSTSMLIEVSSLADTELDRCFSGIQTYVYRTADYYREADGQVVEGFVLLWSDLRLATSTVEQHPVFLIGQIQNQLELFLNDLRRDNGPV